MRAFVAGSTGAINKFLVPALIENGHDVIALIRSAGKAPALEAMGAKVALADPLDAEELTAAIVKSEPEVIIHQLTALVGVGNLKKFDEEFAQTNRFRTEATATMLAAGEMVGTRRFIAQSFCGWLPALADAVGAKRPYTVPAWLGKFAIGDGGVSMMTSIRGGSNGKAKRSLGWQPLYPSWRRGFVEGLG